jgi:hypothetical protein
VAIGGWRLVQPEVVMPGCVHCTTKQGLLPGKSLGFACILQAVLLMARYIGVPFQLTLAEMATKHIVLDGMGVIVVIIITI